MLYSDSSTLFSKGPLGFTFFWLRYGLLLLPIASFIFCLYWGISASSKDWTKMINSTILILSIIVVILSIASLVFIIFAIFSVLAKFKSIMTYLYFIVTFITFILSFVLLSFGDSSHELSYYDDINKKCGAPQQGYIDFSTPAPPPSPHPSSTPLPTPTASASSIPNSAQKLDDYYQYNEPSIHSKEKTKSYSKIDHQEIILLAEPTQTPAPAVVVNNFCTKYWTDWSRKRYIRVRTEEASKAFAGIIATWVIVYFIELILYILLQNDCVKDLTPIPEEGNIGLDPNEQEWIVSNDNNISQNNINDAQPNWVIEPDEDNPQPWVVKIIDNNENQLEEDPIFRDENPNHNSEADS